MGMGGARLVMCSKLAKEIFSVNNRNRTALVLDFGVQYNLPMIWYSRVLAWQ